MFVISFVFKVFEPDRLMLISGALGVGESSTFALDGYYLSIVWFLRLALFNPPDASARPGDCTEPGLIVFYLRAGVLLDPAFGIVWLNAPFPTFCCTDFVLAAGRVDESPYGFFFFYSASFAFRAFSLAFFAFFIFRRFL